MTFLQVLSMYLWIGPHAFQAVLAVVMVRRELHRQFPIFFSYTTFEALQTPLFFWLAHSKSTSSSSYFVSFVVSSSISTCLRFGMFHEILGRVLEQYPSLDNLAKNIFRWMGVLLLLGAAILAVTAQGDGSNRALTVLAVLDRTMSILQCGLLVGLFMFAAYFHLSWRNSVFGIALGLGIFAAVQLATTAFRSQFTQKGSFYVDLVVFAAYHICVLLWMFYLLVPEKQVQRVVTTIPDHDLETWNQELQRMLRQ